MKRFTLLLSAMLLACATNLWAENAVYSLSFTKDATANNYTATHTTTSSEITWDVFGNQSLGDYLRVGGKNTTATDRTLTSQSAVSASAIGKVVINHAGIGNGKNSTITINSISVEGCTNSNFQNSKKITITSPNVSSEGSIEFIPDGGYWDAASYFRISVNYQITGNNNCYITINSVDFFAASLSSVATPVFTAPDGAVREDGTFGAAFNLTISCETEGAYIVYTTDGSDPLTNGDAVMEEAPCTVAIPAATTRVRAIATDGTEYSAEKDVTYTFDLGYVTSIADFIALAPTKAYELRFTEEQEAVIIGATTANLYIQDNSGKGLILYCGSGNIPTGAVVGTKIVGSLSGKFTTYKEQPEMNQPITWAEGVQFVETSRPTPVVVEAIDEATYNAHPMVLVKIEDVTFASTTSIKKGDASYNFFGTQFGATTGKKLPESTTSCDITGILINYDGTPRIYPVEVSDIDTKGALAELPTFDPAGGATQEEATETSQVTMTPAANTTVTINGDTYTAAKTFNITEEYVEMQVTATHDFYADNSTTVWFKAVPSITVEPTGDVAFGTIRKDADMAASAKTLTVKGTYLAEAITATLSDGAAFTLDVASLPAEGGKLTITPVATVGANEAVLTLASGKYTATVNLSATIQDVYTITWSDKGETFATTTVVEGETLVLPANTPTCSTKEFMGWTAMEEIPENATAADMEYVTTATIPTADVTYRAVFATATKGESKSVELTHSSFELTTSYAKKTATIGGVNFTIDQGYKGSVNSNAVIQMNSSKGSGTLYNTTEISGLDSITLNVAQGSNTMTIYQGTTQKPLTNEVGKTGSTATISFAKGMTYFCLKVSGATYFSSIVINYTPVEYSAYSFTCPTTPSAIESAAVETSIMKTIENGQLVIIRDGVKYNAMGVRLQ